MRGIVKLIEPGIQKLILYLHFTKSLNRDNIYNLCLWIKEEYSCLILTPLHVSKLRYGAHVQEYTLLLHCAESFRRDNTYFITCFKAEI